MNCLSGLRTFSLALLCSASLLAQPLPSEQQRLVSVAKLWVTVKFFHPYIASQQIDWDKALVDALPAIRSAQTENDFRIATQSLLSTLHDPLTTAQPQPNPYSEAEDVLGQRSWIHHGLPSPLPTAESFYQAFVVRPGRAAQIVSLPLGSEVTAQVRLSEPVLASLPSAVAKPLADSDYAATPYPPVELRILSAFRIWGTVHNFFAYKDLMDEDWDAVFADALPKFIAAPDARTYHLAVAEMISHLSDSNSTVESHELDQYFGEAPLGFKVRLIEKKTVVTEILDPAVKAAGVKLGDLVASLDSERLPDRIKRQANYLSASTAQALSAAVVQRLLNGPDASTADLVVTGADERPRTIKLKRSLAFGLTSPAATDRPVRVLPSNIGYADLTRVSMAEIDGMFEKLANTTAIIFDARGPIEPVASEIASCLSKQPEVNIAIVTGPLSLEPDLPKPAFGTTTSSYFGVETVHNTCRTPYKGKTVLLIDERTIGNAEHLALAMGAANNTELLGAQSAGADSAATEFTAPGGILIRFSGTDIRTPVGGPIQRTGLQPSLALAPKVAAIRTGRDVVLEKAIEYLRPPTTQAASVLKN